MTETKSNKILVVDDDKFLLDMYSIKFAEQGFSVETALGSEVALQVIENGLHPDIFLVDLLMPKIDGFQLIEKLKEKGVSQGKVVVILSNLGQKEDVNRGLQLGVDGYIIKAAATPSEVVAKVIDISKKKNHD